MTLEEYIKWLAPYAQQTQERTGVPASLIIAQAIQESWKGATQSISDLARKAFNLFGIKAGSSWKGDVYYAYTWEDFDGDGVKDANEIVKQTFRKYTSVSESFDDHAKTLAKWNVAGKDGFTAADLITKGPVKYATDANYSAKLKQLMRTYNLTQYDKHVWKPTDPIDPGNIQPIPAPSTPDIDDNQNGDVHLNFLSQVARFFLLLVIFIFTMLAALKMFDMDIPAPPIGKLAKAVKS